MPRRCAGVTRSATARLFAATALLTLALMGSAYADGNPGFDRPGLGFTPTVLQASDFIWEQGLPDWSRAGDASLYTADTLLRIGLGGQFEFQFGTSYNYLSSAVQTVSGWSDSSLGLKFALPFSGSFSWGLLGSVTSTDGTEDFGDAGPHYVLGAAFNWKLNPHEALGAYLETGHNGGHEDYLVAFNTERNLTDAAAAYAELAWQHTADAGNGTMAGAGLTWLVTPSVQLDASFRHRLGGQADTWQAGLGISVYFGHP